MSGYRSKLILGARAPSPALRRRTTQSQKDFARRNRSRFALIAGEGARAPSARAPNVSLPRPLTIREAKRPAVKRAFSVCH